MDDIQDLQMVEYRFGPCLLLLHAVRCAHSVYGCTVACCMAAHLHAVRCAQRVWLLLRNADTSSACCASTSEAHVAIESIRNTCCPFVWRKQLHDVLPRRAISSCSAFIRGIETRTDRERLSHFAS
jgi:hypothetical protein